jgi:hypothetical protein
MAIPFNYKGFIASMKNYRLTANYKLRRTLKETTTAHYKILLHSPEPLIFWALPIIQNSK